MLGERKANQLSRSICADALRVGSITRENFNIVRRNGYLMDTKTARCWWALNGAILKHKVTIVEDGSEIVEVAVSIDKAGNCTGAFSF